MSHTAREGRSWQAALADIGLRAILAATIAPRISVGLQHDREQPQHSRNQCRGKRWGVPVVGSKGGIESRRICFGGNRQVSGKPDQNSSIFDRMVITSERGFWGSGVRTNTYFATEDRRGSRLFVDNCRRVKSISGVADQGLGKRWTSSQPMVLANRKSASRSIISLYHSGEAKISGQCLTQKRQVYRDLCKACPPLMAFTFGNASICIRGGITRSPYFLRTRCKSFTIFMTSCTSWGISPIITLLPWAAFWPVLCSKMDWCGKNVGLSASFLAGFSFSSDISFLIESVASPMMKVAGEFRKGSPAHGEITHA